MSGSYVRIGAAILLGVGVGALVGCGTLATPGATASPVYRCIPVGGGESVPCTAEQYTQAVERDALVAEADAVYRRYWAEVSRLSRESAPEFTPELDQVATGSIRRWITGELLPDLSKQTWVSGESQVARTSEFPGTSAAGSIITLQVCTDESAVQYTSGGGEAFAGPIREGRWYFVRDASGALKLVAGEYATVGSC